MEKTALQIAEVLQVYKINSLDELLLLEIKLRVKTSSRSY